MTSDQQCDRILNTNKLELDTQYISRVIIVYRYRELILKYIQYTTENDIGNTTHT